MFCVVMTTIRPRELIAARLTAIWATASFPTDLYVMDGRAGIAVNLNYALQRFLDTERHQFYITVDDDLLLPDSWQQDVYAAHTEHGIGVVGLDMSETDAGWEYVRKGMPENTPREFEGKVRPLPAGNVAGCFISMRAAVAKAIGPYPHDGKTRYEFDEDGWRCKRARQLGYSIGYVRCERGVPRLVEYHGEEEYIARKAVDTEYIRNVRGIAG